MRILVTDDEGVSRKKLFSIAKAYGNCDCAPSGKGALDAIMHAWDEGIPYDLLFLDVEMAGSDNGLSVLAKIREMEKERNLSPEGRLKIVMVTTHTDKETVVACLKQGCNDYVMKPFDPETIAKKIAKFTS